jgi:hypothetical protein
MQITEKDIESVPQPIVSLFNDLEQTIMLDIIRRLQANKRLQGQQIGKLTDFMNWEKVKKK